MAYLPPDFQSGQGRPQGHKCMLPRGMRTQQERIGETDSDLRQASDSASRDMARKPIAFRRVHGTRELNADDKKVSLQVDIR